MNPDEPNLPGVEFVDAAVGVADSLPTRERDEIMTAAAVTYSALGLIDDALKSGDEISDSPTRDTALTQIAVNAVAHAPDTDPLSVIESIDDLANQNLALEEIAVKYAELKLFDDALAVLERLDDSDSALNRIAKIMGKEDSLERSEELAREINDDNTRTACLTELASTAREREQVDMAVNLLLAAEAETETDGRSAEDRIYQLMLIGDVYEALNQREKVKELLSRAFALVDEVETARPQGRAYSQGVFLVYVASAFARSRFFDEADRATEQIENPFHFAEASIEQAVERHQDGQEQKALQMLSEARDLITSEPVDGDNMIARNSALIGLTSAYTKVGDFKKGLEVALLVYELEIDPESKFRNLTQLGYDAALAGLSDSVFEIQNAVTGEFPRVKYLILISEILPKHDHKELAAKLLLRALEDAGKIQRQDQRYPALIRIAFGLIDTDVQTKANELLSELVQNTVALEDSHQQAQLLVALAEQYRQRARQVSSDEKQLLQELPT